MIKYINLFINSFLAGVCISIGCIVNIMSGSGIIGAILFTFGLITIIHYKYSLFTGTAGFVNKKNDILNLFFIVLIGNIIGCLITSCLSCYAIPELVDNINLLTEKRLNYNIIQTFIRAVFCGFLMTTAVKFARENKWLPLLFAIPVFIISGFYHSIADSFYFISSNLFFSLKYHYISEVIGNFIGCNLYRIKIYTS